MDPAKHLAGPAARFASASVFVFASSNLPQPIRNMKLLRPLVFSLITAALLGATSTTAQEKKAKAAPLSPPAVATASIDGNDLTINYSQPFIRDPKTKQPRQVWGGVVPYGKVWRTGANAATTLKITKPIVIGGYQLAAGTYCLFTVPTAGAGSKLIINKELMGKDRKGNPRARWGIPYDEAAEAANELARLDLKRSKTAANVDPFTITIKRTGAGAGQISFAWADAQYTIAFKNKG